MSGEIVSSISPLMEQLRGQTVHLPDLRQQFVDWPVAINKNERRLRQVVDDMADRSVDTSTTALI